MIGDPTDKFAIALAIVLTLLGLGLAFAMFLVEVGL